jgi:hypothetical protein
MMVTDLHETKRRAYEFKCESCGYWYDKDDRMRLDDMSVCGECYDRAKLRGC